MDFRPLLRDLDATCARRVDRVEFRGGFEEEEEEGWRGEEDYVNVERRGEE